MESRKGLSEKLLKEWHSHKNTGIDPKTLSSKSGLRPWWQCIACKYEWEAPIYHRSNGTGCPKCCLKIGATKRLQSLITKKGSLEENYPDVAAYWHPTKNGNILPNQVTPSSNKKFWWKCSKGEDHEWEASVSNRIKGKGCGVCAGKRVVGSNCLSTTHPDVSSQWHPTKNGDLLPTLVSFGSHKKVWWVCKNNHEWFVSVSNRTSQGQSRCPICLKQDLGKIRIAALIKKNGSLIDVHPEIAKQWHPTKNGQLNPSQFTAYSGQRVWWLCDKGHEWEVPISARRHHSCPKCSYQTSQLEIRIYCELKTIFSEILWRHRITGKECDLFLPSHKLAIEVDGYPWHQNREVQDKLKNIFFAKRGITIWRIRDDRLLKVDDKDIFYKNKETPLKIIKRILSNLLEKSSLSIQEEEKIKSYLNKNNFVNEIEFKKTLNDAWSIPEMQSIFYLHPKHVAEWDYDKNYPLDPKKFSSFSEISVFWRCIKNSDHTWRGKIKDKVKSTGCPFCLGKRICKDNALATLYPHVAKLWDAEKNVGLSAMQVTPGSSKKVYWKCDCGTSWRSSVNQRVKSGNLECIDCYNKKNRGKAQIEIAIQKNGSFLDNHPDLAKEWHPTNNGSLFPSTLSSGSNIKVWWQCLKHANHVWKNTIVARIYNPTCPYCCGKKVSPENSLQIFFPKLSQEWHPTKNNISPLDVTKFSGKKVWWKCIQGHEWEATVISRAKGRGCSFCQGKKATPFENFGVLFPKEASEWHPTKNSNLSPLNFRPRSNIKIWWRCSLCPQHEWQASISSRAAGQGCPFCAKKRTTPSYNLGVINPTLASDWHYEKNGQIKPADVTPHSGKKVWWKCIKGHEWQANINNRSYGRGCPLCRKLTQ